MWYDFLPYIGGGIAAVLLAVAIIVGMKATRADEKIVEDMRKGFSGLGDLKEKTLQEITAAVGEPDSRATEGFAGEFVARWLRAGIELKFNSEGKCIGMNEMPAAISAGPRIPWAVHGKQPNPVYGCIILLVAFLVVIWLVLPMFNPKQHDNDGAPPGMVSAKGRIDIGVTLYNKDGSVRGVVVNADRDHLYDNGKRGFGVVLDNMIVDGNQIWCSGSVLELLTYVKE